MLNFKYFASESDMEVTIVIYQLSLWERFIKTDGADFHCHIKCMHLDQIGLMVYYVNEKELDLANLRRCLIGQKSKTYYIEAENAGKALSEFYNEYQGARTGGSRPEQKALWLDTSKPIIELPYCERLHLNSNDEPICGEQVSPDDRNGEFGFCVLAGRDPFDDCPIAKFRNDIDYVIPINVVCGSIIDLQIKEGINLRTES